MAIIFLVAAYAFRDDPVLKYAFASLGALPTVASLVAYFMYFFQDRDRLQSEEFVLKAETVDYRTEGAAANAAGGG